jgi:hypothetical protein
VRRKKGQSYIKKKLYVPEVVEEKVVEVEEEEEVIDCSKFVFAIESLLPAELQIPAFARLQSPVKAAPPAILVNEAEKENYDGEAPAIPAKPAPVPPPFELEEHHDNWDHLEVSGSINELAVKPMLGVHKSPRQSPRQSTVIEEEAYQINNKDPRLDALAKIVHEDGEKKDDVVKEREEEVVETAGAAEETAAGQEAAVKKEEEEEASAPPQIAVENQLEEETKAPQTPDIKPKAEMYGLVRPEVPTTPLPARPQEESEEELSSSDTTEHEDLVDRLQNQASSQTITAQEVAALQIAKEAIMSPSTS